MHWGVVLIVFVLGSAGLISYSIARWSFRRSELPSRDGARAGTGRDLELEREVHALRDELDDVREQLAEVHERLDFTERMLTAGRAAPDERNR